MRTEETLQETVLLSFQGAELSAHSLLMESSADSCHNPNSQPFPRGTGRAQEIPVIELCSGAENIHFIAKVLMEKRR